MTSDIRPDHSPFAFRTLELPGANPLKDAHATLDDAVLIAYGFSAKKDLLAQLLALNLDVAARLDRGEPVTAPGVPKNYPDSAKLVTEDCIAPGKNEIPPSQNPKGIPSLIPGLRGTSCPGSPVVK